MMPAYAGGERLLFALWMTGLIAFPAATLVVIGPQAPLLAAIVFSGNVWMDYLAVRKRRAPRAATRSV